MRARRGAAEERRSDGGADQGKVEAVRRLAEERGCGDVVSQFPDVYVAELLRARPVEQSVEALRRVKDALGDIAEVEREADHDLLEKLFLSGAGMVRGNDSRGRPILWIQTQRGSYNHAGSKAFIVFFLWLLCWANRLRRSPGDGIVLVIDDVGRRLLDFSVKSVTELGRLVSGLFPVTTASTRVIMFCASDAATTLANMYFKLVPEKSGRTKLVRASDKKKFVRELPDPLCAPQFFLDGPQRPYTPSFDTVGPWHLLFHGEGFSRLKIEDVFSPCPARVEQHRMAYMRALHVNNSEATSSSDPSLRSDYSLGEPRLFDDPSTFFQASSSLTHVSQLSSIDEDVEDSSSFRSETRSWRWRFKLPSGRSDKSQSEAEKRGPSKTAAVR